MLKAFSKLTKSNSTIPPSADQITKHKDLLRVCDGWKSDVDKLRAIISDLSAAYGKHKGDFAVGRYEELKAMIKSSIRRLEEVTNENRSSRTTSLASSSSLRVSTSTEGGGGYQGNGATGTRGGASSLSRLRDNAADFAKVQIDICATEKKYAEITSKDLEHELVQFNRDIVELKNDFRMLRLKLEQLGKQYEESKRLNPAQRFVALKEMIKAATMPVTS